MPDWPRNIQRTRRRMGQTMLTLGLMIFIAGFAVAQLRGDGDDDRPLRQLDGGWRYAQYETLVLVTVERVIDGDTLDVLSLQTPLRVRMFGVNASEPGERCAGAATARLTALAAGAVRLLPDERLEDDGGRQLRYLFTRDGTSIDAALITEGVARAWRTDGALRDQLVELEDEARRERRGCLWAQG
jgi:endonuclease YncB( thermonuclease family)